MKYSELIRPGSQSLKTYVVKLKLRQQGYTNFINTTVQAKTPEMARRILRAQYNDANVVVGQPKEISRK